MASESCDEVSWASYLALRWINPLVILGLNEQVRLEQSPPLAEKEDTARNTRRFVELLAQEERDRRSHPLIRAIFWAYWPQLLLLQTMKISQYLLGLLSPFILQRVLVFQEAQNDGKKLSSDVAAAGFTAVAGLISLALFNLFYNTQVDLRAARIALRIQAALRGCILFRGVQGLTQMPGDDSAKATTHGESAIYNVISFDAGDSAAMIWVVLNMWILPIQFFAAFSALFSQVAWSVIPGLATIILAKTFNLILGYADGVYRDRLYFAKDERLGRCSEGFTNIRTLRMLAWTPAYQEVIMSARREELRMAQIRLWLQKMPAALDYGLTTLVTLVTLGYYVMSTGETLKASVALPVIGLIGSLIGPIGQFPNLVRQYKVFRSAYDRLDRFLGFGCKPKPFAPELPDAEAADGPASPQAALDLQDCSFSWTAAKEPLLAQPPYFELSQIDLTIQAETLLAIISQEGQGKSSMLLAMMGEMPMKAGHFTGRQVTGATSALVVPPNKWEAQQVLMEAIGMASRQCTAFAPQEPWIFAGTLRSNILFGLDMNESLYDSVLEACALKPDLASFPSGDLTDVAAGGSTISGGQRARVSLARAAYRAVVELQQRQSPLVLLDDPFCALDKEVAKQVCKSLLSPTDGLLRRCTVMVAAADPWWLRCLTDVGDVQTGIVILRSGKIFAQGRVAELRPEELTELRELRDQPEEEIPSSPQMRNPQDMDEEGDDGDVLPTLSPLPQDASRLTPSPKPVKLSEAETQTPLTKEQEIRGSLKSVEGRVAGHVQCSTYLSYLKGVGYVNFTVMFLALAGIMLFQNFCSLWIVYWTSEKKDTTFMHSWLTDLGIKPPTETSALLKVYACLILGFFISNFAGHALEIIGGIRAAKKTFASALTGALHRPFHWWDTNPTGRVLNRFSEDVEVMDKAVTNIFGVIIGAVLYFLGHTMVLTFSNPMSIWLLPLIILLMEYFARYYRNTVRELQCLFLVSQSEVYQEMTDAITGGITIRAFAAKEQVLSRCLLNLEEFQRASFTIRSLQLWIGLRLGLVGFIMSVFNQLQPILMYYGVLAHRSAALVGFSISYSSEVSAIVSQFVMNFSDMEMQLVSIERLCEYAKPQNDSPAANAVTGNVLVPRAANGGLELRDVVVKYQSALSPALAGVTLHFPAGETVAVVGRTGAGKSSLLLAVLQLAPYTGDICVDGQSLRGLSEQVCGTLVAVVPQQPVLFSGTLRWNLDPALQFTDAQIWDAIKTVGLLRSCSGTLGLKADVQGSMSGSQTGSGALALSLGQRQLLCAARALLRSPKVALLDEVTAALPGELALSTVTHLVKKFRDINATTLLVTHQDDLVSVCDRTVRLSHGSVVSDTIAF